MRAHRGLLLIAGAVGVLWWLNQRQVAPAGASPATGQPTVINVPRALNQCQGCGGVSGKMQWQASANTSGILSKFGAGFAAPAGGWACVCGG